MVIVRFVCLFLVVCTLTAAPIYAQNPPGAPPAPSLGAPVASLLEAAVTSDAASPSQDQPDATHPVQVIDLDDVWHLLRRRQPPRPLVTDAPRQRSLVVAPTIGSKPTTGLTGGLSGNVVFYNGDPASTHLSAVTGGMKVSEKGQVLTGSRVAIFTDDDRWFLMGDNRMSWTSQSLYALGIDAPSSSATASTFDVLRLYDMAYRKIGPGLFVGAGLNVSSHFEVEPGSATGAAAWEQSAYVAYNKAHGLPTSHQTSSGADVSLRYDTRDNGINPEIGALASATYRTFFDDFLGGNSTWQELSFDARTYRKLTKSGRQKLACWFLGDLVTGGTAPYWDLPSTSMDGRSARGYAEGRYRGEHLLYWETEYRATLTSNGLLGMVAFANVTTIGSAETGQRLFQSYAPGAGVGLRVLLNKRSRTNLCADWGWGKQDSHGFYLAIQEAF